MIDRPIRALIKSAGKRQAGDIAKPFPKLRLSTEFRQLSAALSRMSNRINELLKQKDLLLRELQHRVMNSLNILSSLLDVQRRYVVDPAAKEHLGNARDRIIAMGTVYRHLYQAHTLEYVEFSEFLHTIDRKSTRLNSSHLGISYAVFCLKKKKITSIVLIQTARQSRGTVTQTRRVKGVSRATEITMQQARPGIRGTALRNTTHRTMNELP